MYKEGEQEKVHVEHINIMKIAIIITSNDSLFLQW